MSHRIEKINDLIRDNLSQIIQKELSLKKEIFITVTKVNTSKDLSQSRVFVSIFPTKEKDYSLKTLENEIHNLQKTLNQKIKTKIVPKIIFCLDESQKRISDIEKIFEKIKNENNSLNKE